MRIIVVMLVIVVLALACAVTIMRFPCLLQESLSLSAPLVKTWRRLESVAAAAVVYASDALC